MLTKSFQSIATATRQLLTNWRAMIMLAALYAALLATLYLFVTIREASTGQVALTLALALIAPVLFFVLQTAGASQLSLGPGRLLKESLRNFWKVVVVTVPLIALALLGLYVLGKAQTHFGVPGPDVSSAADPYQWRQQHYAGEQPLRWSFVTLTTIRYLFIGLVLPIVAIHLWIASVGQDFLSAIKKMKELVIGAFAPNSVLIYMAGFLVFAVIPYLLLFSSTPANKAWLEISLFVARLCIVFGLTLFGWVITMGALAVSAGERERGPSEGL